MNRKPYPTDLTDDQWERLDPLLPRPKSGTPKGGRPATVDRREVVNAIFYHLRGGQAWRMLPHDFPWHERPPSGGLPGNRAQTVPSPGVPRVAEPMEYRIVAADAIDPAEYAGRPDAVAAITACYTAALVRRHPGQYFWLHRRWKHQPAARKGRKVA